MVLLYVAEALACFLAAYVVAVAALGMAPQPGMEAQRGFLTLATILALSSGPVSGAAGLYDAERWWQASRFLAGAAVTGVLLLVPAILALLAVGQAMPGPSTWVGLPGILLGTVGAIGATRLAFVAASRRGLFTRRIAVVRDATGATSAEQAVTGARPYAPFEVALVVGPGTALADRLSPDNLQARDIWGVVIADGCILPEGAERGLEAAGFRAFRDSEFCERHLGRVDLKRLHDGWLDVGHDRRHGGGLLDAALRRAFDVTVALLLLLLTLPITLLTALAVRLDSPGPVFYRQERVGLDGRVFTLMKFRSMRADAEAAGAPQWAAKRDSRVTRVGRFIRLTRIDEIPQVLNVLRGDMAFIGPRPERPAFVEQLAEVIPHYRDRACVKPGITGWAQINFPYGASVEDARGKLAYDLYYVRRRSLFLDLLILVATVRVVLFQEGSR
jgi:exopolysaccharide biosynthesis polyprenyl glycosylphosphotransferase